MLGRCKYHFITLIASHSTNLEHGVSMGGIKSCLACQYINRFSQCLLNINIAR